MIPMALSLTKNATTSELKLFTPEYSELDNALTHALRTARYFAKQRNRDRDLFFIDEMCAEAVFIVTQIIMTELSKIREKYPCDDERFKFYRMSVGYGLKSYCAYRSMRTMSFLRAKGIETKHVKLEDDYVPRDDHAALMNLILEEAAKTPMEKLVLQYWLLANTLEVIGEKVGLAPKRVRKVLKRIKRRLRETDSNPAGV